MFFSKKNKKSNISCPNCSSKIDKKFSFCPHCSCPLKNSEEDLEDFGMLGKEDVIPSDSGMALSGGLGITDKLFNSIFNSLIKSINKQMREVDREDISNTRVQSFPNGIRISVGPAKKPKEHSLNQKNIRKNELTEDQTKRMSKLPRAPAKTSFKRIGDKIVYEMNAPGIKSPEDVFISKLETGYEIKAIGEKKVYVNSIQIELPINNLSIREDKLFIEFNTQNQ